MMPDIYFDFVKVNYIQQYLLRLRRRIVNTALPSVIKRELDGICSKEMKLKLAYCFSFKALFSKQKECISVLKRVILCLFVS